jgi:hypothetical protein
MLMLLIETPAAAAATAATATAATTTATTATTTTATTTAAAACARCSSLVIHPHAPSETTGTQASKGEIRVGGLDTQSDVHCSTSGVCG